jgi:hypothetical protein
MEQFGQHFHNKCIQIEDTENTQICVRYKICVVQSYLYDRLKKQWFKLISDD